MTDQIADSRYLELKNWLSQSWPDSINSIHPLAGDASFRRYFRVMTNKGNFVAMDSPTDRENSQSFFSINKAFAALGLHVPEIYQAELKQGFLLIEDFGDTHYLNALTKDNADKLYNKAMRDLAILQTCPELTDWQLPKFDYAAFMLEFSRFQEWYLVQYLGLTLTPDEKQMLQTAYSFLISIAHEQPQVCVHRDYHSRNLMYLTDNDMGILDFQDAVVGPITYDLMSLLRDCYIHWPQSCIEKWIKQYYRYCIQAQIDLPDFKQFQRWFDLMSIQRHLKVLYIFSRLKLSYGNPNYIQYIPRVLAYLQRTLPYYPELNDLKLFIERRVLPNESNAARSRARQTFREVDC